MPDCSPRVSFRHWMLAPAILLMQMASAGTVHAQSDHKQILVLHSTRRDAQISMIAESDLARAIDAGLAGNLDYYSEFIDVARFPDPAYRAAFRDFMQRKYQAVRFDLVVALQETAIEFITREREALFRDAPVVFLTNRPATPRLRNSTGLIHERDFASTMTMIRLLQPDVRHIFVVTGAAQVDKAFEDALRRQLPKTDSGPSVTYLSGLETKQLEERLSTLPEHSAVYYLLVDEDAAGHKFHPLEYVDRIAASANAPTYCWVDSAMDHGIVGGSFYGQRRVMDQVARLSLRVLRGEPTDSIPVAALSLNANEIDWRQLRRWHIDEARVPPGTVVRFRDPTIWDRYRIYILAALTVLVTQTVLIAGLLIQQRRRQLAEDELRVSQGELRKSYDRNRDLGARLLTAQETERSRIARELHDDICQRMLLLTIQLESLDRAKPNKGSVDEALTVAGDVSKSLHELSHRLHPASLQMIGLVAALERLCLDLSRAGIAIVLTRENVPSTLPAHVMLGLFRLVQEGLQNAIKHSNAKKVRVHLEGGADGLNLSIIDDGVGFDVDAAWAKGLGLVSMVERLETIGGSLKVQSSPGAGTSLTAAVQLEAVESGKSDAGLQGPIMAAPHDPAHA